MRAIFKGGGVVSRKRRREKKEEAINRVLYFSIFIPELSTSCSLQYPNKNWMGRNHFPPTLTGEVHFYFSQKKDRRERGPPSPYY